MFGRKKRTDDDLQRKGLAKVFERLCRFILYPVFHPFRFLTGIVILLVLAFVFPLYNGVSWRDVPAWWGQKILPYYQMTEKAVQEKFSASFGHKVGVSQDVSGFSVRVATLEKIPGREEMVSYETTQNLNRRAFEKARDVPVDVRESLKNQADFQKETVDFETQAPVFRRVEGLSLVYEPLPYKTEGRVKVVNANEIKIDETSIFLYGVYVPPSSDKGFEAGEYLRKNIEDKNVLCWIGAQTEDGIKTGICFYNGVNINKKLVEAGLSQNVGLY